MICLPDEHHHDRHCQTIASIAEIGLSSMLIDLEVKQKGQSCLIGIGDESAEHETKISGTLVVSDRTRNTCIPIPINVWLSLLINGRSCKL